jgi:nicotinamidase/pyrazinamidase
VLWPDHCVQGTDGAAFHADLATDSADLVLRKGFRPSIDSYSAFYENDRSTSTGLAGYLRSRGISRLFFTGIATDFCVAWSAIDGTREGFEVAVIEDGCRGIDLDGSMAAAWEQMAAANVMRVQSSEL